MPGYSFVKKANFKTLQEIKKLVEGMNPDKVPGKTYWSEKTKSGYVLVYHFEDGINSFTDRAAIVRCNHCGAIRELFDGQIEFCDTCDKDW